MGTSVFADDIIISMPKKLYCQVINKLYLFDHFTMQKTFKKL